MGRADRESRRDTIVVDLDDIWHRWIELHRSLEVQGECQLARPFLSVAPEGYFQRNSPKILYVGKATRGHFAFDDELGPVSLEERKRYVQCFLDKHIATKQYASPFWRFASQLDLLSVADRDGATGLDNLIWTNICKLGVKTGNPRGLCLKEQLELAKETLRREIEAYRPKLVVLVTWAYADDVIKALVSDQDGRTWHQEHNEAHLWWREPRDGLPAFLWTRHPQGIKNKTIELWTRHAEVLLNQN